MQGRPTNLDGCSKPCVQQASCLEGGPLLWIWPLYLHVNQKSDDDDDDDVVGQGPAEL